MMTDEQIEQLLARFFDGATDNEEERTLYRFFRQKELPDRWKPYREMFDFFEQGMEKAPAPKRTLKRTLRRAAGIAASLLIMLSAGWWWTTYHQENDKIYVTRNGVMLTNPEEKDAVCREIAQQVHQQYQDIVNAFPDEATREEVKRILGVDCNKPIIH
ncbi:MAG: hypothetical protein LBM62_08165 [Mediterranea sp.]|jgi:hypothetical protein|nr:hypothetical protein [Mediterranea sp.]